VARAAKMGVRTTTFRVSREEARKIREAEKNGQGLGVVLEIPARKPWHGA